MPGGFFGAVRDEQSSAAESLMQGSSSRAMSSVEGERLVELSSGRPMPTANSGRRNSAALTKQMNEQLHQELFKLYMKQGDEQERLDIVMQKQQALQDENNATTARIEEIKVKIKVMEDPMEASLYIKQEQLLDAEEMLRGLTEKMEDLDKAYKERRRELLRQMSDWRNESTRLQTDIHHIEHEMKDEVPPPGPLSLKWVSSINWSLFTGVIIICNFVTMFLEFTDPDMKCAVLNTSFLLFYQVELMLNLIYYQQNFLIGKIEVVWWNWMDLVIVLSGTLEFVMKFVSAGGGSATLSWMRILRVARLGRLLKVVKLVILGDMSWTEGHAFQTFMMAVIGFNCILMGLEVEFKGLLLWKYCEQLLLFIFTFELFVRIKSQHCTFFTTSQDVAWNWLDFVIVVGGIFDSWMMPCFTAVRKLLGQDSGGQNSSLAQAMTMLRMVRLARILRLVRLIKNIPPLYTLVIGIAKAMQGMGWVMVLTVGVLYICALIGVQLVGQGWVLPHHLSEDEADEVKNTFADIPESIFNLFKAMNADLGGVEPLLNAVPASKYIMMAFMVVTNWAIFSILTAVVSDNMAKVTEEHDAEIEHQEEVTSKTVKAEKLAAVFKRADADGDGLMNLREFHSMLKDEVGCEELCKITGLLPEDLEELFDLLATENGKSAPGTTISHDGFMKLLEKERTQVTARSMMKIEKRLTDLEDVLVRLDKGSPTPDAGARPASAARQAARGGSPGP